MMDVKVLKYEVIIPVLIRADMHSESAVQLMLGTAAVESHMGEYLYQIEGPAIGLYQIEPDTHIDTLDNYVAYRPELQEQLNLYSIGKNDSEHLVGSLHYQTLIARLKYYRVKHTLPKSGDIRGMANYWKDHYNTHLGKGTPEHFEIMYKQYVGDL